MCIADFRSYNWKDFYIPKIKKIVTVNEKHKKIEKVIRENAVLSDIPLTTDDIE